MALYRPGSYSVVLDAPNPYAQRLVLTKLTEYSRELQKLQMAAADMRNAIVRKDLKLLTNSVKNSQDWLLSLVETQSYIHNLLEDQGLTIAPATGYSLYGRAADLGTQRGRADRKLSQHHSMTL